MDGSAEGRLTRGQVAHRLNISVSTVRRYEGVRLHPTVDGNDVRWFDAREVAALAAELVNEASTQRPNARGSAIAPHTRSPGEIAALVFERLEQRQSLAEIVIGLRIAPETVRTLFDQWTLGLTEGQLRMHREPAVPRTNEIPRVTQDVLASHLARLPEGELTRISVARYRGAYAHGDHDYLRVNELGGFHAAGPVAVDEIVRRYGGGSLRITAYGFDPGGVRWEMLVDGLTPA
ncbi:MAG: hypothetical protein F9K40_08920 [Kofleriaceae bacterium]|nr:MAG: hypothetical protein F9K40_08920 [Kofleriaceae bacterium]